MGIVATRHWHRVEDGRLQCDVCPRGCTLRDGQRGLCFVRAREGEQIVLTTYGRSSGFCVDPIEKKPLNHFLPGTPVLSFGTAGCNLGCRFCQNWDISKSREMLHAGMELAHRCGAAPLVERAREELLATGARPRRIMRSGVDALTPSEKRVARMAGEGLTNREIAQALFVTMRTVEVHLTHAYQKLDISSREELPRALRG